jgi:hypothetical protein
MNILTLITSILSILASSFAFSLHASPIQKHERPSREEMESVSTITKIIENVKGEERLWPGYDFTKEPLVITFDNGHVYGFHLKSNDSAWKPLTVNQQTVLYSSIDLWEASEAHMNPQFPIGDQKAYVFHLDAMKGNPFLPFLVLVHERFHQHQFSHFDKFNVELDAYQDDANVENIALMLLEEHILSDFLKALPSEKKEILRDFMAVSKTRRGLISTSSDAWELFQQRMEGLADYASIKLFDNTTILPRFDGSEYIANTLQSYINDKNVAEIAMKWRHYGVGSALGYALDCMQVPGWKEKLEKKGLSQIELLEQCIKLSNEEITARLEKVKQNYNYSELHNNAEKSLKEHQNEIASGFEKFNSQEGICINVSRPPGLVVAGAGNSQVTYQLSDGSMMLLSDTSQAITTDHLWRLEFNNIPVLFQKKGGFHEFKVETNLEIKLDEKNYNLQDIANQGVTKSFNSIAFEGRRGRFASEKHPGTIFSKDSKVFILFDDI